MSGSSLDGLDLAFCSFELQRENPGMPLIKTWRLLNGETRAFTEPWRQRLKDLPKANALEIMQADVLFGHYVGDQVNDFLKRRQLEPDFIAFHGHTIFHTPSEGLSVQIGDGAALAVKTTYPVINQFRQQDVANQGQGAPLAAIADKYLLPDYDFCLNLGGIANVTAQLPDQFIAFDICPANQLLNAIAAKLGLEYDDEGRIAASGKADLALLNTLNQEAYYHQDYPKTLDNFWGQQHILSKIENRALSLPDQMRTAAEHITDQIAGSLNRILHKEKISKDLLKLLPTGGGVFNAFLMKRLENKLKASSKVAIHFPDPDFANFKEAILMALMGVLRVENIPNVMHTVTGGQYDTISGAIHQGYSKMI